jgi:hypothetical protein
LITTEPKTGEVSFGPQYLFQSCFLPKPPLNSLTSWCKLSFFLGHRAMHYTGMSMVAATLCGAAPQQNPSLFGDLNAAGKCIGRSPETKLGYSVTNPFPAEMRACRTLAKWLVTKLSKIFLRSISNDPDLLCKQKPVCVSILSINE